MSHEPAMNPDIPNEYRRSSNARQVFLFLLVLAVIVAAVPWLAKWWSGRAVFLPGRNAPPIVAVGWLNGEAPTKESLSGKVVFLYVWATWCGPCRRTTPQLVELHKRYAERGVVFIGLTSEEQSSLQDVRDHVQAKNVTWLIGWGALETLQDLGTEFLPSAYVIGADGKLLWDSQHAGTPEEALEQALALAAAQNSNKG